MPPWFTAPRFLHFINCTYGEHYHEARFEKESRYYVIRLSKDLLEDWVITLINGRIKSKLGHSRTLAFTSFNKGFEHFCALAKKRNLRGYQLKTLSSDNHLLLHLLPFMVYAKEKKHVSTAKSIKSSKHSVQPNKKSAFLLNKISPKALAQQLGFAF
ncbi:WGR domain-containing protein [Legionella worsleiensis]|nr:Uncharacterised protein [Legionella worsleiensis]